MFFQDPDTVQEVATVVDARALAALLALLLPLLIEAITKRFASDRLKAVLNIVGSAVITVVAFVATPDSVINWVTVTNVFITSLVASFAGYKGLWKPTGVAGAVSDATGNFGVGSATPPEVVDPGDEEPDGLYEDPEEDTPVAVGDVDEVNQVRTDEDARNQ